MKLEGAPLRKIFAGFDQEEVIRENQFRAALDLPSIDMAEYKTQAPYKWNNARDRMKAMHLREIAILLPEYEAGIINMVADQLWNPAREQLWADRV